MNIDVGQIGVAVAGRSAAAGLRLGSGAEPVMPGGDIALGQGSGGALGGGDRARFESAISRASAKIDKLNEKFVSSAMLIPLINQMTNDPFRTEMFHGGYAEEVFQSQLNVKMADQIAGSTKFPLVKTLGARLKQWLEAQPIERIERIANDRGLDALG